MREFYELDPSLQSYWRSIILFGRNVASYKFALAKSLLELKNRGDDLVKLEDLSAPFASALCEHLRHAPRQATSGSSKFLAACEAYNSGEKTWDELIGVTERLGFKNVIDAFHVVNQSELPVRFFIDERRHSKGIRITDTFFSLMEHETSTPFAGEVEARWRLVETAWSLNVSRNLIGVSYDGTSQNLHTLQSGKRVNVTSCRDALNGYQKGTCFYCNQSISILSGLPNSADVDHFFPHLLSTMGFGRDVNGVWNLVLACPTCNRGEKGKFARLPSLTLLHLLKRRNDYLISSHHPLRETLIRQTGASPAIRHSFLQHAYDDAKRLLIHTWDPALT